MRKFTGVFAAIILLAVLTSSSQPPSALPPGVEQIDLSLPSAGATGGTLAVRLFVPSSTGHTYFSEGAPLVIEVPGGDSTGSLLPPRAPGLEGFVYITFLFPGGRSEGRASHGVYDHRGHHSIEALRDVALFASGQKSDAQGRTIDKIVRSPLLTQNVGLLTLSNGGSIAVATMALYGEQLANVKYLIDWENPSNGQIVTTDAGPGGNVDCPPGAPAGARMRFANPYYRGYGPVVLDIDYSHIAYGASADRLFLDGNGNGKLDRVTGNNGCLTTDLNGNGKLDSDEDLGLSPMPYSGEKKHYSLQVVQAVRDAKLFSSWPPWLDTPEESDSFWQLRDAARNYDALAQKRPDLRLLLLASVDDHVQTPLGKPHIRQAFEGFARNKLWAKINPSRASVTAVNPQLQGRRDLPENAPNAAPADWNNYSYAYPEGIPDAIFHAAGVREMAELVRAGANTVRIAEARGPEPGSLDAPYSTERIELVQTLSREGLKIEFYRNRAYTCGLKGYQTFMIAYPANMATAEVHPLWVRMHGGGTGAFTPAGRYLPSQFYPNSLDEEPVEQLTGLLGEPGLMAKVRAHPARFRFLMPSMCDHDLYSGVGLPEPNNPNSPDENGHPRAADGLLATKAAIAFARAHLASSHIFLHGTSAGGAGAFTVAYSFEREGLKLSGIVMDSGVIDDAFAEVIEKIARKTPAACVNYAPALDFDLLKGKIGPALDPANMPKNVIANGAMTVPIMHVWNRADPTFCGATPITFTDADGSARTMAAADYVNEGLRRAIEAHPGRSENLRMCVTAASGRPPCAVHSPTKFAHNMANPPGDQDRNGLDYNQYILEWVTQRLSNPPPAQVHSLKTDRTSAQFFAVDAKPNAGPVKVLNGVHGAPHPLNSSDADLTERYQAAGITIVRLAQDDGFGPTGFTLASIFPDVSKSPDDPAAYNFTPLDRQTGSIINSGVTPLFEKRCMTSAVVPPH